MPQPSRRSVFGSMSHLVIPSVRPTDWARPLAAHGNWATLTSRPCCLASVSVRPAQAISGSVKTTAGDRAGLEHGGLAVKRFDGHLSLVGCLMGEHGLAGHVADRQNVRVGGPTAVVDRDKPLSIDLGLGVFESQGRSSWGGVRPIQGPG